MPTPDGYLTLDEASGLIPGRPERRQVYYWATCGLQLAGETVLLQAIRIGRRWLTRRAWVGAFIARMNTDEVRPMKRERAKPRPAERRRSRRPRIGRSVRHELIRAGLRRAVG